MAKYAPKCKLNYLSLGELPVSDDKEILLELSHLCVVV